MHKNYTGNNKCIADSVDSVDPF